SSYWSSGEYVGSGPYRLVQWDPGVDLVFDAAPSYVLGRPALDRITLRVMPDANALVADLLSGSIDATIGATLTLHAASVLKEQWGPAGGRIVSTPTNFRHIRFQY